jgi:transcriptional regulator with XRE-family HTH domain
MRQALSNRDISAVYWLLRRKGTSQRLIAATTGQSQSEVSEILKGRQVMAYDVLARIADGLGVPRGYMGLAYDGETIERVALPTLDPQLEEDELVKRRRFIAHAAAVAVGAVTFGEQEAWASNMPGIASATSGSRIGSSEVRQLEAATKALRALDYQYGGGFCRDAVEAQLSWGKQLLTSSSTDLVRKRLYVALADLHNLAGWTSFDSGLSHAGRMHFGRALELAKEGGNETLVADTLYRMGRVYLHEKSPQDALKLFQLGQLAAQASGSNLAVAILCANEAWSHAMLGNAEKAVAQLNRTRDEFARAQGSSEEVAPWAKFFDLTDLTAMIGTVHTVIAQEVDPSHTKYAIPALMKAVDNYGDAYTRSKAFNLSALATNHLIDGDVAHGVKVGGQALDIGATVNSDRVKDRLIPLQVEARKRSNVSDAAELAERIAQFRK